MTARAKVSVVPRKLPPMPEAIVLYSIMHLGEPVWAPVFCGTRADADAHIAGSPCAGDYALVTLTPGGAT